MKIRDDIGKIFILECICFLGGIFIKVFFINNYYIVMNN